MPKIRASVFNLKIKYFHCGIVIPLFEWHTERSEMNFCWNSSNEIKHFSQFPLQQTPTATPAATIPETIDPIVNE